MCKPINLNNISTDASKAQSTLRTLIARVLRERLATDKGFSYCPVLGLDAPYSAYMVSLHQYESVYSNLDAISVGAIADNIVRCELLSKCAVADQHYYVGGWVADNGKVYLDISINIHDLEEAKAFGRENRQLAIWDCRNKVSINL